MKFKNLKKTVLTCSLLVVSAGYLFAQIPVDLSAVKKNGATISQDKEMLAVSWPAGKSKTGKIVFNLTKDMPLFKSIQLGTGGKFTEIAGNINPVFILTIGKRTLSPSSGGWDVFFDRVPRRPYHSYNVEFSKNNLKVSSKGIQTIIQISEMRSSTFTGALEITLYNGSPLFNVAAVLSTNVDSTAILYDAGLVCKDKLWENIGWSDVQKQMHTIKPGNNDTSTNLEVKYRTVIGQNSTGSLALFPAPHQYFYPLDEAFNLKFTWYGRNYHTMIPDYGIGIRQDPLGDKRYVPWFNAPPGTLQRLNFFCLLSTGKAPEALAQVKQFTHNDSYPAIPGYKTMATHFHNEFTSKVPLAGLPLPEKAEFVEVAKEMGINIMKLAEFHGPGHPKGPDSSRLRELKALFEVTKRYSNNNFLLLPGEEANNFYGGHWLAFFPKPVYWVMSRKPDIPFRTADPTYGTVYHVGNKDEMLKLLELEKGLAWTAHARTKASTGYPDIYKNEKFFTSETFLGAAWKAIPADLSLETLSKRVLNLMDDMANWGLKKNVIAESDIFTITHQNEMYAHVNINYVKLPALPAYKDGWQPVLNVMRQGKFFVSTGEITIPSFTINGKGSGETLVLQPSGTGTVRIQLDWTFPLNYAEIVSGDGNKVYRERINLDNTREFGKQSFTWTANLKGRKWVRVEIWDIAANGAFTQIVYLANP
jgi:hypothetical protein